MGKNIYPFYLVVFGAVKYWNKLWQLKILKNSNTLFRCIIPKNQVFSPQFLSAMQSQSHILYDVWLSYSGGKKFPRTSSLEKDENNDQRKVDSC